MPSRALAAWLAVVVVFATVGAGVILAGEAPTAGPSETTDGPEQRPPDRPQQGLSADPTAATVDPEPAEMVTSSSSVGFRMYVESGRRQAGGHHGRDRVVERNSRRGTPMPTRTPVESGVDGGAEAGGDAAGAPGGVGAARDDVADAPRDTGGPTTPSRYSGTNVQVEGIDEPDIVKTDGRTIYYAREDERHPRPVHEHGDEYREPRSGGTSIVDALPPESANVTAKIDATGDLLLVDETLVVVDDDRVAGYDVSDPSSPERLWERDLSAQVETARLQGGQVYLVLAGDVDSECPVEPVDGTTVECTEIRHPDRPVSVDVTYTVATLDPGTGTTTDSISFVGTHDATVYMSSNGIYTTYTTTENRGTVRREFLLENDDLLPARVTGRLRALESYDLSREAERAEVEATVETWLDALPADRRREVQRELDRRRDAYAAKHKRAFTTTHVVRVGIADGLDVAATGAVPGAPLNQFSMSEHDGHLRIATTVGERRVLGDADSENDLYVLDTEDLSRTGAVTGMGKTERIYSVRFVGDTGYIVTFRRIDPFHVVDLSDPSNPTLQGELKLPGFSSYLHPLSDEKVLGIGEEDGEVKAVVFDVSDPTDPRVSDSRILDSRWSAIAESHHAFLLDRKHGVFFLPTRNGGHVFAYDDGLRRVHTVDVQNPQRALYIDDYLYVFGDERIAVVDERTWDRVRTVDLER